jgi:hypothetical protein
VGSGAPPGDETDGESVEPNQQAVDVRRFVNAAARLMIAGQNGLPTVQKWRRGGKQTVVVQYVDVSDGGQAWLPDQVNANQHD